MPTADFGGEASIATAREMNVLYRAAVKDPASKQKTCSSSDRLSKIEPTDSRARRLDGLRPPLTSYQPVGMIHQLE
jgi:hypothetical protein